MSIAAFALAGLPLTSGFLSKDAILIQAFEWSDLNGTWSRLIPYSALLTSWLTAFYIARLVCKVFFGKSRLALEPGFKPEIHEAPGSMKYVMLILAIFCLFPIFSYNPLHFSHAWVLNGFSIEGAQNIKESAYHYLIPVIVNTGALALILLGWKWYAKQAGGPDFSNNALFRFSKQQWFFDAIYQRSFVNKTVKLSKSVNTFDRLVIDGIVNSFAKLGMLLAIISNWLDTYIIDALVNSTATLVSVIGNFARRFQTGVLQHYLLSMVLIVLTFFIVKLFFQAI
jgi:NADH-quinone oxidoreductase subunit L